VLKPAQIESRVRQLLREQGIQAPPVPTNKIAASLGAVVRKEPFVGEVDVSGALDRSGAMPVIGVNSNHHPVRQRFTIAHEIGHLLLHAAPLHIDPAHQVGVIPNVGPESGRLLRKSSTDYRETEANRFAAALLMPQEFLTVDLTKAVLPLAPSEIARLARRYDVSQQAMTFRLLNLGIALQSS
jgi:Zn-dependent peptidase ImmA (M78 family)